MENLYHLAETLRAQAQSKHWWLNSFSSGPKKRPDHEIDRKRKDVAALEQASDIVMAIANRRCACLESFERRAGGGDGPIP